MKKVMTAKRRVILVAMIALWIILLLFSCMDTFERYYEIMQFLLYFDCGLFGGFTYGLLSDLDKEKERQRRERKKEGSP